MLKLILDFFRWLNPFKHHKVITPVPNPIPPPPVVIPDPIIPFPEPDPTPIPTPPTLTSITITPNDVSLTPGQTQQFTAVGKDRFDVPLSSQPTFNWSITNAVIKHEP